MGYPKAVVIHNKVLDGDVREEMQVKPDIFFKIPKNNIGMVSFFKLKEAFFDYRLDI